MLLEFTFIQLKQNHLTNQKNGSNKMKINLLERKVLNKMISIKNIFFFLCLVLSAFLLASCGAAIPEGDFQTDKNLFVDMGMYSVGYPVGDDWSCKKDKFNKSVKFLRQKTWWTGKVLGETSIKINVNEIKFDSMILDEKKFADEFRKNELEDMREGVAKDQYDINDIINFDTTFSGKKYYCVSYTKSSGNELIGGTNIESILAVFVPPEFGSKRIFYTFLIEDSKELGSFAEMDARQIYPVLKTFIVK